MKDKLQINILIPIAWKQRLDLIAHQRSIVHRTNLIYSDIIRETLQERFGHIFELSQEDLNKLLMGLGSV